MCADRRRQQPRQQRGKTSPPPRDFLFYDLETSGVDARADRIVQFASIRTKHDFTPIQTDVFTVQLDQDILPDPMAVLVTGLTPEALRETGVPEIEACSRIAAIVGQRNTMRMGFNSAAFDDEFLRNLFYRHLHPPYDSEWRSGNARYDVETATRAASVFEPNALQWPVNPETGENSYRLGSLAQFNHFDFGERGAHDALADVEVTIALARKLSADAPRTWRHAMKCADKSFVEETIATVADQAPLLHMSKFYGNEHKACAPVAVVGPHPTMANRHMIANLHHPIEMLLDTDANQLQTQLFSTTDELEEEGLERPPLGLLVSNKAPFVTPYPQHWSTIQPLDERVGFDRHVVADRFAQLNKHRYELTQKLRAVFAEPPPEADLDPELAIYDGFPSKSDQSSITNAKRALMSGRVARPSFDDPKYATLYERAVVRSTGQAPSQAAAGRWQQHVAACLKDGFGGRMSIDDYRARLGELESEPEHRPDAHLLAALRQWGDAAEQLVQPQERHRRAVAGQGQGR